MAIWHAMDKYLTNVVQVARFRLHFAVEAFGRDPSFEHVEKVSAAFHALNVAEEKWRARFKSTG